jgi:hypothetical protein
MIEIGFLGEIKDELNTYIFDFKYEENLIQLLRSLGTIRFTLQKVYEIVNKTNELKGLKVEDALNVLYKCNAIGNINNTNNRVVFKCIEQTNCFNINQDFQVHRGLWSALNLDLYINDLSCSGSYLLKTGMTTRFEIHIKF